MDTTKRCRGCNQHKPLATFNRRIGRCGRHNRFVEKCEPCAAARLNPSNYRGRCKKCQYAGRPKKRHDTLVGPPSVVLPVQRKHACPADIRRAFDRAQTRHAKLAELQAQVKATSESTDPKVRAALRERHENARCWAVYSLGNLDSLCVFATTSLAKNPGHRNKRKTRELTHLLAAVSDWKKVLTVRYRLRGQDEAFTALRGRLSRIIGYHANRSAREREEAEANANLGVLKAIEQWDPTDHRLAKFTTYGNFKVWRATQARKDADTAPGKQKDENGVYVTQTSTNATTDDDRSDGFHPVNEGEDARRIVQLDVRTALAALPLNQCVALQAKTDGKTLKEIAEEQGLTVAQVRTLIAKATETLRMTLASHARESVG